MYNQDYTQTLEFRFRWISYCNSTHSYIMPGKGGGSTLSFCYTNIMEVLHGYAEAVK